MKTKLRPRFYCDFCRKSGGSASAMSRHESACTANPNRVCKMCVAGEIVQKPLAELIEAAKADDATGERRHGAGHEQEPEKLLELTQGCPACILTALRLSGVYLKFEFDDYKKAFWDEHTPERQSPSYSESY